MTLEAYFQEPDAQRYLLVEITRNDATGTVYYLSDDGDYITEPGDTPANTPYTGVIGGTGLSDIRRTLNDPFSGQASTGFGVVELANGQAWTDDNGTLSETEINLVRGATVEAWVAGPPKQFARTTALKLLTGKIGRVGGSSTGRQTFEVVDGSDDVRNRTIEITDKPLCFGYCRNVTPFLADPALLEYYVHDGPIDAVLAVYDQGAALTVTTQYTVDLSTGKITLLVSPVGVVTADVRGDKPSGTWFDSTEEIASALLSRAGVSLTENYSLPTGVVGLYVTQTTLLGQLLNRLMAGCAGYWLINALGEFQAAQYPVPQETTGVASFTAYEELGEIEWTAEDRLYSAVNYSYRTNWTQYQARPAATAAQADFAQRPNLSAQSVLASPDAEILYQDSPIIETLFDSQADAEDVADRVLSIYSVQRKLLDVDLPYSDALQLGQNISVSFGVETYIGAIISVVDIFDGGYPYQKVKILV